METVTVSPKFQVVIPKSYRKEAGIKPGDKLVAIMKHGILYYVRARPVKDSGGRFGGVGTEGLRDEEV